MNTLKILLIFVVHAAFAGSPTTAHFTIDPKKIADQTFDIYVAPNVGTTIQFPEDWIGTIFCGNCMWPKDTFKSQLFKIDDSPKTNQIAVSAIQIPGQNGAPPAAGYITSLTVTLRSGITITALLHIAMPDSSHARVIFQMPGQDTAKAILGEESQKREAEFHARVKESAAQKTMEFLSTGVRCKDFKGTPYRNDGLVVRLKQLCRASTAAWISFEVQNRMKTGDVVLKQASMSGGPELESDQYFFSKPSLAFDEVTRGATYIELADSDRMPSSWTLDVFEDGGPERKITAKNITF